MTVTYTFPVKDVTAHQGYATLTIINGKAEVDEKNKDEMELARSMNGEKVNPQVVKKVKRGEK